MEPNLLLRPSGVIKDHRLGGELVLVEYVAVVLTTRFHFLQPLLEDLHVLWHNVKAQ